MPLVQAIRPWQFRAVVLAILTTLIPAASALAQERPKGLTAAPPIRLAPNNLVPSCVTPDRLMAFLRTRTPSLDPRFRDIAHWYKVHGEAWRVRWDFAFFQMAIETNFLSYLRPNGRRGDVDPRQNNFAGIGTTGGGVPGDSYPDVSTGVLAQIQHLVVYSGQRIDDPVAPRTRLKQDHILLASQPVAALRAVNFQDLSGRWAVDKAYGRSISWVAERFAAEHCGGRLVSPPIVTASAAPPPAPAPRQVPAPAPAARIVDVPPPVSARPGQPGSLPPPLPHCRVQLASYGGTRTVLVRRDGASETELTALSVLDGFEQSMVQSFLESHARGGVALAAFATRAEALDQAYKICPGAKR
ncbi:MAG: hypothetical protein ACOYLQ_03545 [Hyphomicrobiaceae bacterium]